MPDSLHSLTMKRFEKHPLIAKALAAVAAEENYCAIRASLQVASRVHCPAVLEQIPEDEFFHASPAAQEKALLSLEGILEDLL